MGGADCEHFLEAGRVLDKLSACYDNALLIIKGERHMVMTVSARDFARDLASAKRAVVKGPVFITNRGKPAYALLKIDDYHRLASGGRNVSLLELMDSMPSTAGIEYEAPKIKIDGLRVPDFEDGR
jgi:prevent-host-death family protein